MDIPAELIAKMDEAISHYPASKRSASLPLLHLWQEHFGFVSDEAVSWIAAKLELQPINILELVTFYPMFRRQPIGIGVGDPEGGVAHAERVEDAFSQEGVERLTATPQETSDGHSRRDRIRNARRRWSESRAPRRR